MCSTGFWAIFIHRQPVIWGFSRMKHLTSKRRDLDETPNNGVKFVDETPNHSCS